MDNKTNISSILFSSKISDKSNNNVYVNIIEEPEPSMYFEGFKRSRIFGTSSTFNELTSPTIKVYGYQGRAIVLVSCVTKDEPYRPHPFGIFSPYGENKNSISMFYIPEYSMTIKFRYLYVQRKNIEDIETSLKERQSLNIDPFKTGFSHITQPDIIDLTSLRLCFQVYINGDNEELIPLKPVISQPIHETNYQIIQPNLDIVKLSHYRYNVNDTKEIIILCSRIYKNDIKVRFYEEKNDDLIWEEFIDIQISQIHKRYAIYFKPPKYNLNINEPVEVYVQLIRPSDGSVSEPVKFFYLPIQEIMDET